MEENCFSVMLGRKKVYCIVGEECYEMVLDLG